MLYLSILTLAEYDKGVHQLADENPARACYQAHRHALEVRFSGRVLPLTNGAVERWGSLAGRTKRDTGQPPSVVDTMLAATALEADLYLVTRNVKDVRHAGAVVFNPWQGRPQELFSPDRVSVAVEQSRSVGIFVDTPCQP